MNWLANRFGTLRGAIRLGLSYIEVAVGRAAITHFDPADIRRLVFVCHGNICRSAYADAAARKMGLRSASFGLSADAGKPAHPPAVAAAAEHAIDLNAHRAQCAIDFVAESGDLLFAMETRQLRRIAADARLSHLPRTLLGLYGAPPTPHVHDPYELDDAYMQICLARIDRMVANLARMFPGATVS